MDFQIGFGQCPQPLRVPDENLAGVLEPNEVPVSEMGPPVVQKALQSPIGTPRLGDIVKAGEKVVVITSDITRPVPSYDVLPSILDELNAAGVPNGDITVVFALGSHRAQTEAEQRKLVGDAVYDRVRCVDSDPDDYIHMGQTSGGTPVDITRVVAKADRRICVANIEYHYFAGYSGGAKPIMPGVSTRAAIQANHSNMVRPEAAAGRIEGNPVRADLEEAIGYCPIDFIVNVVLDEHKKIIHAVAGHFIEAHRAGCRFLDSMYLKRIPQRADIVIASQGGAPKDLNLYQTQKALDNAKHAVKKGGVIILVGSCKEGLGEHVFEEWIHEAEQPDDLVRRVQENFELGGHKAAAIALVLQNADVYLVSEMDEALVKAAFLKPYTSLQTAFDDAMAQQDKDAQVLVMPYAGSTLPLVE